MRSALAAGATLAVAGCGKHATAVPAQPAEQAVTKKTFSQVVDLTHTLSENFPTYAGKPLFSKKLYSKLKKDGFNSYNLALFEHVGTHIDAPIHFSDTGRSVDQLLPQELVVPLYIVDIQAKADKSADAQVTVEDLKAFEAKHGPIAPGTCVAMNSGWWRKVATPQFQNADGKGIMHFPGFEKEAVMFLDQERKAAGIAVDTLSLDYGPSKDFATHNYWLPSNHWGIECLTNLDGLPAVGATIVVGAPKIEGGTGGPSRVFALV